MAHCCRSAFWSVVTASLRRCEPHSTTIKRNGGTHPDAMVALGGHIVPINANGTPGIGWPSLPHERRRLTSRRCSALQAVAVSPYPRAAFSQHPPAAYLAAAITSCISPLYPMAGLVFTKNASKRYAASRATYQFPDVRKLLSCQLIPLELIFDEGILRAREIS
jgi:hypothetical protein